MYLSSPHNPRVKQALKLRERKGRQEQGRIIINGAREIERALAAGVEVEEVFRCLDDNSHSQVFDAAHFQGAEQFEVAPHVMEKISYGDRCEGLVATAKSPMRTLRDLVFGANPLIAVLAAVEKPGNIGAVVRSADGAGLAALIVADGGTDLYNPNVIRASRGVVFSLPVCSATSAETIAWLHERQFQVFTARVDGQVEYTSADLRGSVAIILGSEAEGLPAEWNSARATSLKIPMLGQADSLNVSCTAAVLFYEALRQRQANAKATVQSTLY